MLPCCFRFFSRSLSHSRNKWDILFQFHHFAACECVFKLKKFKCLRTYDCAMRLVVTFSGFFSNTVLKSHWFDVEFCVLCRFFSVFKWNLQGEYFIGIFSDIKSISLCFVKSTIPTTVRVAKANFAISLRICGVSNELKKIKTENNTEKDKRKDKEVKWS